jgi:hypothetical protein
MVTWSFSLYHERCKLDSTPLYLKNSSNRFDRFWQDLIVRAKLNNYCFDVEVESYKIATRPIIMVADRLNSFT